jgi:DNA polymerase-3 subunit alpha
MSSNLNNTDQIAIFFDDAKNNFDIDIARPDINESESLFTVRGGKIIYGLAAIKGVGVNATAPIIEERNARGKFKNLTDFAKRCAPFINKRVLEAFAKVGVLDSLEPNRAKIFMNADAILAYSSKQKESAGLLSLFDNTTEDDSSDDRLAQSMSKTAPWTFGEMLGNELSALGFYISAHPLDQYKKLIANAKLTTSATLPDARDRAAVQIAANVNSFNRRRTKAGKDMITINASDSYGNIDAVAFGESSFEFARILDGDSVVLISGKASNRDDRCSVFVDSIIPLNQWVMSAARKITLEIFDQKILPDVKKLIDALPDGATKVALNIHGDKVATLMLPRGVRMTQSFAADLHGFGIKTEIE